MHFTIAAPVEHPLDSYVVEIKTMMGDADGWNYHAVGPFKRNKDEASLQSIIETLRRMETCRTSEYDSTLGYQQWFCAIDSVEALDKWGSPLVEKFGRKVNLELIKLSQEFGIEWNMDALAGYERPEKLREFNVFYYDLQGVKHHVIVNS